MSNIEPVHYRLAITPDLADFTFKGTLYATFDAAAPAEAITLNILELTIRQCRLIADGADAGVECPFATEPEEERLTIRLPSPLSGRFQLRIDYDGQINDKMAGFYRSRYADAAGNARHIAITQFQESDARRAFPCFDHPRLKAGFDLTMIIDEGLTGIGNMPVERTEPAGAGKKRLIFARTPRISTYLIFFGVGEFEVEADAIDPRVRAVALPGLVEQAAFGRQFGRKALAYCEHYYDIPYPLAKMDLIAVPDFAFGAMENWGAITFRENLLLTHPATTSRDNKARICEVIAHEIVHQWFGNLVTPSEWKYLWLNESFATYFGFGVVDHHYPEWGRWDDFLLTETETAFSRDAMLQNFAIEIPGGEHVVINVSTAPLIYNKGGSILRQIEGFIGTAAFQKGLRHYLKNHAYGCATSRDLWRAYEAVSDKPVTAMMENWIGQPGHPVVTAERKGATLTLTQRRFTFLPNAADQTWMIPVSLRIFDKDGAERVVKAVMDGPTMEIALGANAEAYAINDGHTGFYRTQYASAEDLAALGERARSKTLSPRDRWGLQSDLYALMRGGVVSVDAWLDFLDYYQNEDAPLALISISDGLHSLHLHLRGKIAARVERIVQDLLGRALSDIGLTPAPDEALMVAVLRDKLLPQVAGCGGGEAMDFCLARFADIRAGRPTPPDIQRSALKVGAMTGGADALDWMRGRLEASESEHERQNLLMAMGLLADPAAMTAALDYTLASVPDRNRFIPIVSMTQNRAALNLLWDWYVDHREALETMHPLLYERVIASIVPTAGVERADEVGLFLADYVMRRPAVEDVASLSLERMEINRRLREANRG